MKSKKWLLFLGLFLCQLNYTIGQAEAYRGTFVQKASSIELGAVSDNEAIYFRWASETKEELDAIQKHGVKVSKLWEENGKQFLEVDTLYFAERTIDKSTAQNEKILENTIKLYQGIKNKNRELDPIEAFSAQRNIFYSKLFLADISMPSAQYQILGYVDRDVKTSIKYDYTFKFLAPQLGNNRYRLSMQLEQYFDFLPIADCAGKGGDRVAELEWNIDLENEIYAAYYIEKSTDGKQYNRLNSGLPFRPMNPITSDDKTVLSYFTDSLRANGIPVYYRLQGINFFGQLGPYSETIKIVGQNPPIPSRPSIVGVQEIDESYMEIVWHFNPDFEDQVKHFRVENASNINGPFTIISSELSPSNRSFLDESPQEIQYYRVVATDVNNHLIPSPASLVQRNDIIPPAKPSKLTGSIDSAGIVSLKWDPNTESDLDGYNVFYCNTRNGEYSILTNRSDINDCFFQDTIAINTLGKVIFYKILAIDFRGNQSLFSDPLELRRPDYYPPVPAVFKLKRNQQNQVYMSWGNSSSSDLASNELQRSTDGEKWITISANTQRSGLSEFVDTDLDCSVPFYYRIKSTDHSSLVSFSDIIQLQCISNGKLSDQINLQVEQDQQNILLSWSNPYKMTPSSIIIYRSIDGKDPLKIKQFWPEDIKRQKTFEFSDKSVRKKTKYQYYVVLRYPNRQFAKSELSDKTKLKRSRM